MSVVVVVTVCIRHGRDGAIAVNAVSRGLLSGPRYAREPGKFGQIQRIFVIEAHRCRWGHQAQSCGTAHVVPMNRSQLVTARHLQAAPGPGLLGHNRGRMRTEVST